MDLKNVMEYSENFTKSRQMMKSYMMDMAPGEEARTYNILLNVYESGIIKNLYYSKKIDINKYRLCINKIAYDYGMTEKSTIEALDKWLEICIDEKDLLECKKYQEKQFLQKTDSYQEQQIVGTKQDSMVKNIVKHIEENGIMFEDTKLRITFLTWNKTRNYGKEMWVATCSVDNKTNQILYVYMKDIYIGNSLNLQQTEIYPIPISLNSIQNFCLICEGNIDRKIISGEYVSFKICYSLLEKPYVARTFFGQIHQSPTVYLRIN